MVFQNVQLITILQLLFLLIPQIISQA